MTIMAELWQFMSRSDMTRDNMSQALGAWGLGLFFIIPDPRSMPFAIVTARSHITNNMDQGSVEQLL